MRVSESAGSESGKLAGMALKSPFVERHCAQVGNWNAAAPVTIRVAPQVAQVIGT